MSSLPASTKRIRSKATEKRWRHRFPHYKSMGAFCCHGNQSFDAICPKTLYSLSPTQVMLLIKFDQDWPTGFRDIQVWKCGRRRTTTTTDGRQVVYYKLTLWAFGSGELKIHYPFLCQNFLGLLGWKIMSVFPRRASDHPRIQSKMLWTLAIICTKTLRSVS